MPRRVIVHCHIYKNAGSSIDRLLWESFGDGFAVLDPSPGYQTLGAGAVQRFLNENPYVKAISSHRLHPPFDIPGALPVVMLRHPVDRPRSAYAFARGNPDMPDHPVARDGTLAEYVAWSLATRGEGAILRNYQVHHLSGAAYRADDPERWAATENDLREACAVIADLPAFGLVRRFGDSCRLFNALYRPLLPAVHFFDWAENATGDPAMREAAALAEIQRELGDAGLAALEAANALDLQLYAYASRLFESHMRWLDRRSTQMRVTLRLLAGRVGRRIAEGATRGAGSSRHPDEPAYVRLPP
jgi:hypothetical protein